MGSRDIVEVDDLVRAYGRIGLDVRRFFDGPAIALKRDAPDSFGMFTNCRPGDEAFYSALMERIAYSEEKSEFENAASFLKPSDRVLDVGCGLGHFSDYCKQYKGIELNAGVVAKARALGRNVCLEPLEAQPADSFDAVALFQILEHVPDPLAFLKGAVRTIRPGGIAIIAVPNEEGVCGTVLNSVLNYPPHHLSWWSPKSLDKLVSQAGLEGVATLAEPLQRANFSMGLFAWMRPREESHFDFSFRTWVIQKFCAVLGRLVPRQVTDVPFAVGHTLMMVARKPA
jgi:SAM-dependent methyltransferase